MSGPFKMKGHTLPGPNQASPMKQTSISRPPTNNPKYKPDFKNSLASWGIINDGTPRTSIKSLREYKLGVVFTDKYGRETPILTSESGGFKVEKKDAINANRLKVGLKGAAPANVEYFKFYIKETSTEYYNLPMDRWYEAEDGNIWLAFPSSDRNKVDIDTTLFLKKGDGDDALENTDKYKILAIENEAPEFIKTRKINIGEALHNSTRETAEAGIYGQLFGSIGLISGNSDIAGAPTIGDNSFSMNYEEGEFTTTSISHLEDIIEDFMDIISEVDRACKTAIYNDLIHVEGTLTKTGKSLRLHSIFATCPDVADALSYYFTVRQDKNQDALIPVKEIKNFKLDVETEPIDWDSLDNGGITD